MKATLFVGARGKRPAFCAGGDVKSVYESGMGTSVGDGDGDSDGPERERHGYGERNLLTGDFFREEYVVNHAIATQDHDNMPQVSVWDGVVMGGGVGLSIHGKYRVATENTLFAMPETAIGLFPDVGGTWWLPRLRGGIGPYIALTGARLKADDLIYAEIATHYLSWQNLGRLRSELAVATEGGGSGDCAAGVLASLREDANPEGSFLATNRDAIEAAFGGGGSDRAVEDIVVTLENMSASGSDFATKTLSVLRKMSPTSLKVTLEGLRRGGQLASIDECLQMEYRMAQRFMRGASDFYEGVRAVLVDKDGDPKWNPAELELVSEEEVGSYFQTLGENELILEERKMSNT